MNSTLAKEYFWVKFKKKKITLHNYIMGDKYPFLPQGSENLARSPVNSNIPHVCILLTCNSVTGKFKQFSGPEKP